MGIEPRSMPNLDCPFIPQYLPQSSSPIHTHYNQDISFLISRMIATPYLPTRSAFHHPHPSA